MYVYGDEGLLHTHTVSRTDEQGMIQIKKYANRKLYDTHHKRYITLEGIAALIRAGKQIEVRDNESGAEITATVLAQIVAQEMPASQQPDLNRLLTQLIQSGSLALETFRERQQERRAARLAEPPDPADLTQFGIPRRSDVLELQAQIAHLNATLDQLLDRDSPPDKEL